MPKLVKIHDDDCDAILDPDGKCPRCGFYPDMQSIALIDPKKLKCRFDGE